MNKFLCGITDLLRCALALPFLIVGELCFYVADFLTEELEP